MAKAVDMIAAATAGERQLRIKNIFVDHDRFREAFGAIKSFHYPVEGGVADTGSVSVLAGDSRTGKTYAVKRYVKDHPPRVDEGGMVFPVVYADMPIDGGFRGVLESLAEALQVNFSLRMNNPALLAAVLRSLQERRTELLLLDEFQEIFNPDNPRLLNFGRKLVRKILNLGTLNVICIGLMDTYTLMAGDEQLTGRGGLPYRLLRPYEWESSEERLLFRLLCDEIDRALPFAELSGLKSAAVAQRLHWVTRGNIGRLKDFLFYAGCLAINDGAARIESTHFADAYDQRKPPGTSFNPFRDDLAMAPQGRQRGEGTRDMSAAKLLTKKGRAHAGGLIQL